MSTVYLLLWKPLAGPKEHLLFDILDPSLTAAHLRRMRAYQNLDVYSLVIYMVHGLRESLSLPVGGVRIWCIP